MSPFPKKKFPRKAAAGIMPAKPKPPLDDLESPDPVEGKPAPDPEEEAEPDDSGDDYGGKFVSDMIAPLISAGLDPAAAKKTLSAQFRAGADCLDGGEGEDAGLDGGTGEMPDGGAQY